MTVSCADVTFVEVEAPQSSLLSAEVVRILAQTLSIGLQAFREQTPACF